jgi:hypothetical protein
MADVVAVAPTLAPDDRVQQMLLRLVQPARDAGRLFDQLIVEKELGRERVGRLLRNGRPCRRCVVPNEVVDGEQRGATHARKFQKRPTVNRH